MLKSGATPFLIELKISPSLEPCFHSLSVRSCAGGVRSLPGPPSAFRPWQFAQYGVNACLPAAIDSGDGCTGFWILAASGVPWAAAVRRLATGTSRSPTNSAFTTNARTLALLTAARYPTRADFNIRVSPQRTGQLREIERRLNHHHCETGRLLCRAGAPFSPCIVMAAGRNVTNMPNPALTRPP